MLDNCLSNLKHHDSLSKLGISIEVILPPSYPYFLGTELFGLGFFFIGAKQVAQ